MRSNGLPCSPVDRTIDTQGCSFWTGLVVAGHACVIALFQETDASARCPVSEIERLGLACFGTGVG